MVQTLQPMRCLPYLSAGAGFCPKTTPIQVAYTLNIFPIASPIFSSNDDTVLCFPKRAFQPEKYVQPYCQYGIAKRSSEGASGPTTAPISAAFSARSRGWFGPCWEVSMSTRHPCADSAFATFEMSHRRLPHCQVSALQQPNAACRCCHMHKSQDPPSLAWSHGKRAPRNSSTPPLTSEVQLPSSGPPKANGEQSPDPSSKISQTKSGSICQLSARWSCNIRGPKVGQVPWSCWSTCEQLALPRSECTSEWSTISHPRLHGWCLKLQVVPGWAIHPTDPWHLYLAPTFRWWSGSLGVSRHWEASQKEISPLEGWALSPCSLT